MTRVKTLNSNTLKERRVPDFLPVCLQDFLHGRKSELREQQPLVFAAHEG